MRLSSSSKPARSPAEEILCSLQPDLASEAQRQARIKMRIRQRISAPDLLSQAKEALTPAPSVRLQLWQRIAAAITPAVGVSLWQTVRDFLMPASGIQGQVWSRITGRLHPAYARVSVSRPLRWVAVLALCVLAVRLSPFLFLAPHTIADSTVTVSGNVSVLISGLWQPVKGELILEHAAHLQTDSGTATIVLYDDAVVRMAPHTTLSINDFSDRPKEPAVSPTVSLQEGTLWMLGLVPTHLTGISIGTTEGQVIVHEGSVSIEDGTDVTVRVWDRSAVVSRRNQTLAALEGQQIVLRKNAAPMLSQLSPGAYENPWVVGNLNNDAVHQHEIAQMQQERRAANAGILPDSTLYPAKRFAEAVDVLFTLDPETRARKVLSNANTRLNEAAALIVRGSGSAADIPLKEYQDAVIAMAQNGSGSTVNIGSLLQQEVLGEATADVSAALPDDKAYILKETIRNTIAALPSSIQKPDTQGETLLDELTTVKRQLAEGDVGPAKAKLDILRHSLARLADAQSPLPLEVQREMQAGILTVTAVVQADTQTGSSIIDQRSLRFTAPVVPSKPEHPLLTDAEINDEVLQIRNRIIGQYKSDQGRMNQLHLEFMRLEGNPDQGRILRKLAHILPEDGLATYVRTELERVGKAHRQEAAQGCTGSGC